MALSRIWSAFIIIAVLVAGVRCFAFGETQIFTWMVIGKASDPANPLKVDGIIETCWVSVEICLRLIGILTLFIGFMSIDERAGGVRLLARIVAPFFSKLFNFSLSWAVEGASWLFKPIEIPVRNNKNKLVMLNNSFIQKG